ncbi:uncharacterized protein SPAPADRAFT_50623 [Spathaspora passalidarum NRRL Y-27907]|uniref:Uncharacterized protein n=1 Tax=Spathaspora passalidarum (strain NRRL Y-27907 / 11-Y1) TaxID=619300 RepID=G3ANU0_SPAPN|nr:uncharacterized protein SPAPADRAFT_50623 [Spathaspora passalidarum NRRL Y-27907]EGW32025.1 hypothetical protein SPAPADRAFT_50623 [Spathaspora passalidarum NRRL Y-27907]
MDYRDILLILLACICTYNCTYAKSHQPQSLLRRDVDKKYLLISCGVITNPYENPVDVQHYTIYNVPTQSVYTDIPQDDVPPYEKIDASIVPKAEQEVEIKEVATKEPNAEPKDKQITEQKE